jgi:hypothetical protein
LGRSKKWAGGSTQKRVTDEGYHDGWGEERKQWDRWKIRVLGRVGGSMEKKDYK